MKRKKRVALYHHIIHSKPVRGPMVFFPLFNREYQQFELAKFELFYIIRTDNAEMLRKRYTQGSETIGLKV
jgi:hypothetical protein